MRRTTLLSVLWFTVCAPAIASSENWTDEFQLSIKGFGTVGASYSDDEVLAFRRDISRNPAPSGKWSLEQDSLLGLQLDLTINDKFSAATQLVAKKRVSNALDDMVEWAYGRYNLSPDIVLRGGRIGFNAFLLSDYRNVGFAYLWARPPVDFYGVLAFDSFDGVDLTKSYSLESGTLRVKAFAGVTDNEFIVSGQDEPISIGISPLFGFNVEWEDDRWRAFASVTSLKMNDEIDEIEPLRDALNASALFWPDAPGVADDLSSRGKKIRYYSAGLAYDGHPWRVQTEVSLADSQYKVVPSVVSAYASVGYKIGSVTLFSLGGITHAVDDREMVPAAPLPLQGLAGLAQQNYDFSRIDQRSLSLGARWDVRYDTALKLQWDHTWVRPYGGALLDQRQPLTSNREIDLFSLSVDFVF